MANIILNSFSIQMLSGNSDISIKEVSKEQVKNLFGRAGESSEEGIIYNFNSYIGHQDTANILTSILGFQVPMNRANYTMTKKDTVIVAQIGGGRLPEGCIELPEGVVIKFYKVNVINPDIIEIGEQIIEDLKRGGYVATLENVSRYDWGDLIFNSSFPRNEGE